MEETREVENKVRDGSITMYEATQYISVKPYPPEAIATHIQLPKNKNKTQKEFMGAGGMKIRGKK